MLLQHLFGGDSNSLRFRMRVAGLSSLPTVEDDPAAKRARKPPNPRVGNLDSVCALDRWRHGAFDSSWWRKHFVNEGTWTKDSWWYLDFRKKFRVPPCLFTELKGESSNIKRFADSSSPLFKTKGGPPRIPLDLKMAACLRVLATGCQFDACEEPAGLDKETLRRFFHDWMAHLADNIAPRYIKPPQGAELDACLAVYAKLGFPGACMSVDATHCPWDRVPSAQHAAHKGKESFPSLVWNCHVTHDGQFRHVELAQAGARNDKTLAHYDWLMQSIKNGSLYSDKVFSLYDENGNVTRVSGLYLICDGGYHMWRCCQFPLKHGSDIWTRRWSKRMESVRKDVERAFGIVKKRFRILKVPFLFKDAKAIHNVFVVCCMLHNRLLKFDGLHKLGRAEQDWIKASLTADDARVDAQNSAWTADARRACAANHDVDVERHAAHFELRDQLMVHYRYCWQHQLVNWRVTAAQRAARIGNAHAHLDPNADPLEEEEESDDVDDSSHSSHSDSMLSSADESDHDDL